MHVRLMLLPEGEEKWCSLSLKINCEEFHILEELKQLYPLIPQSAATENDITVVKNTFLVT